MINECKCGEILGSDVARCPACGVANEHHDPRASYPRLAIAIIFAVAIYVPLKWDVPWYVGTVGVVLAVWLLGRTSGGRWPFGKR
jgi:hypothetical protein